MLAMEDTLLSQTKAPQTPLKESRSGPEFDKRSFSTATPLSKATPSSSPDASHDGIFSPPNSVSTQATEDYGWDTPTRKPHHRFDPSFFTISSLSSPSRMKAKEPSVSYEFTTVKPTCAGSLATISTSLGSYSNQTDQNYEFNGLNKLPPLGCRAERTTGYRNTTTVHPIHEGQHAKRRSMSLGQVNFYHDETGKAPHGKPRSRSLSAPRSGYHEDQIDPGDSSSIQSSTGVTPDVKLSPPEFLSNETSDVGVSRILSLSSPEVKDTENFASDFDLSAVTFDSPQKDETKSRLLPAGVWNGVRRHNFGVSSAQLRNASRGRSRSTTPSGNLSAAPGSPDVQPTIDIGRNALDTTLPQKDSSVSSSSRIKRHSMNLMPDIDFVHHMEPHRRKGRPSSDIGTNLQGFREQSSPSHYSDIAPSTSMTGAKDPTSNDDIPQPTHPETSLNKILPRNMGRLFHEDSSRCVASKKGNGERCLIRQRGSIDMISAQLLNFINTNTADLESHINDLVNSILCKIHMKVATKEWRFWRGILPKLNGLSDNVEDYHISLLFDWIHTLKADVISLGPFIGTRIKAENNEANSPPSLTDSTMTTARPKSSLQELEPYCPLSQMGKPITKALEEICNKPLSKLEIERTGFIYIYWCPGHFGRVKIGYTGDVNVRLNQWERQCGKRLYVHFPREDTKEPLRHIFRVEKLIHAELRDYRKMEPKCPMCSMTHFEWFELDSVDIAVDVAKKWIDWMRQKPYIQKDFRGEVKWTLSDEALESLENICKPHERLSGGF
ncbi:GIY-YIG nuclease family protein [Aspergillus tanneri]|uniref:Bacteriophage T5 Orf172 DNA-binding domain-containing protein n=1 Tax=Aspergillus tanneri TaxID=1220188 RepID=A0A5M9MMC4_9EURO|nr:uncharacterized protein ATNIH1004_005729 [Aspergillus tanneri]KAA8647046.1 hypothetical protein ATNIH1004_005729 [Aspergillus tanneri]